MGGRSVWTLPVAFPLVMTIGGIIGMTGVVLPIVEIGIALSILVLGLAIAFKWHPIEILQLGLIAIFAICHGYSHGVELPDAADPAAYAAGLIVPPGRIHICGIAVGGIVSGILGERHLVSEATAASGLLNLFPFIGPLCCVIAGSALASPAGLRAAATSAAAALSGAALGFLIALHDPSMGDARYLSGAAAAGLYIIASPPLLLRHVERSRLTIPARVVARPVTALGPAAAGSESVVNLAREQA